MMFTHIHERLGTAGFIIAVIALIAAMTGGAYAALSASDKKVVKKEAKKFSKQFSKQFAEPGPPGPAGTPGAKGDPGAAGKEGATGKEGKEGKQGLQGKEGKEGKEGPPGPLLEELTSGETLKGFWSGSADGEGTRLLLPISFPFPVLPAPTLIYVEGEFGVEVDSSGFKGVREGEEAVEEACPGTPAAPDASPGFVCVYTLNSSEVEKNFEGGFLAGLANPTSFGVAIPLTTTLSGSTEEGWVRGTWAVTAS
jgi:hypothetical protein